jgi:hypothetical protein
MVAVEKSTSVPSEAGATHAVVMVLPLLVAPLDVPPLELAVPPLLAVVPELPPLELALPLVPPSALEA